MPRLPETQGHRHTWEETRTAASARCLVSLRHKVIGTLAHRKHSDDLQLCLVSLRHKVIGTHNHSIGSAVTSSCLVSLRHKVIGTREQ